MILNVVIFKNIEIDAFTHPQFIDVEPSKAAEQLKRSLILNKDKKDVLLPYRNLKMFDIGVFDDSTGKCDFKEPVELFDCSSLVRPMLEKLYTEGQVTSDVKESESVPTM